MKRTFAGTLMAVVLGVAVMAAQKPAPAAKGSDKGAVTFYGCLVTGSTAGNYTLLSAEQKGQKGPKVSLKLVPTSPKLNMEGNVLKEVEVSGTLTGTPSATTTDLPTLNVTGVKFRAEYCG
jgi:hypothetical protein